MAAMKEEKDQPKESNFKKILKGPKKAKAPIASNPIAFKAPIASTGKLLIGTYITETLDDTMPASFLPGTNLLAALSGSADPVTALAASRGILDLLPSSEKHICLGGSGIDGKMTATALNRITQAIVNNQFIGYDGICYYVENGDSGLSALFRQSFQAAQDRNLKVLVTVDPNGLPDGNLVVQQLLNDANINYLSPLLYKADGTKVANLASTEARFAQGAKSYIAPSIDCPQQFFDEFNKFNSLGSKIDGFLSVDRLDCSNLGTRINSP
jgi:hypothetical protein